MLYESGIKGLGLTGELSKRTGLDGSFCKFRDYQGGEYGTAVLSRFPVVELELEDAFLPESGALKTLPLSILIHRTYHWLLKNVKHRLNRLSHITKKN